MLIVDLCFRDGIGVSHVFMFSPAWIHIDGETGRVGLGMSRLTLLFASILLIASLSLPMFQPAASQVVPTVTVASALSWQDYFNSNPACAYPFNPYFCNEGRPVTVGGYLTSDGSCTFLYDNVGVTYVVSNLPSRYRYPPGAYQVYGYVYPDWPLGAPFPPYPFARTTCVGIPLWAIPPYAQSETGGYSTSCNGPSCWTYGNVVTVYGWLPTISPGSGCVNLYTGPDQRAISYILWNVGGNYVAGHVAVTGMFQQVNSCGGNVLSVISITPT